MRSNPSLGHGDQPPTRSSLALISRRGRLIARTWMDRSPTGPMASVAIGNSFTGRSQQWSQSQTENEADVQIDSEEQGSDKYP
jgi:hypothetical protein